MNRAKIRLVQPGADILTLDVCEEFYEAWARKFSHMTIIEAEKAYKSWLIDDAIESGQSVQTTLK